MVEEITIFEKSWTFSISLIPRGIVNGFSSIFCIDSGPDLTSKNCFNQINSTKSGILGAYFLPDSSELLMLFTVNNEMKNVSFGTRSLNITTDISITHHPSDEGEYAIRFLVNNEHKYTIVNYHAAKRENVKIYVGDGRYQPANVEYSLLKLLSHPPDIGK